ncbi:sigma-70 family RNA polymerase sigma factor [Phycicoccus sp. SLBN-51]|uniref:sigma-70 family RNA polymerase sigma factor n=1 Tax=Phycicoccus sp. SLBN-51 TaxID=2768447 RepID=UPI001151C299|nr:sigma-70 family RNA polymerase sigma factor [Phycicoccus sp. SLBN-51]
MSAFERLWADLHPGLIRYLRVVAVADADDIACESWVDIVRRLPAFDGDETAWRAEVFTAARMHAEDENQRRVWDAMAEDEQVAAVLAEPLPFGDEPFEGDEVEGGPAQGLRLALEAIRDLPPEQGDVLMLRRVAELPEAVVADIIGSDLATVHALEQQALDRLGLDAELLGWALAAEPRPVELADEATVVGFFRAMVPEQQATAGVAVLTKTRAGTGSGAPAAADAAAARVITLPRPTWRARAGAVAAVSAGVIGLGALSAAAYQGALPDPVQNVMHVVIGAPEPTPETGSGKTVAQPHKAKPSRRSTATAAGIPAPASTSQAVATPTPSPAGRGLCQAWAAQLARPGAQLKSPAAQESSRAFRNLAAAAGGRDQVIFYCAVNHVLLPALPPVNAAPQATTATPQAKVSQMTKTHPTPPTKTTSTATPKPSKPPVSKPQPSKPTATATPSTTTTTPTTTAVVPPTATTNGGGAPAGAGAGGNGSGKVNGAKGSGSGAAAGQAKSDKE